MSQAAVDINEIEWGDTPIKHCEFIRSTRKISSMKPEDVEDVVINATLGSLSREDKQFIIRNMTPALEECIKGSKQTRITYLHNLMKLLTYRYKMYKGLFYGAVKASDLVKAEEYNQRVFHHYEALRCLKKRLIAGKELLLRDMPKVEFPQ
ncbi:MAG: hypothetical protein L6N94_06795 [Candidatus Methylarchaceae archaeon HK01M]|nr:hypothetical protein [Candidatus Methylarchaceae archaeon HK01M]